MTDTPYIYPLILMAVSLLFAVVSAVGDRLERRARESRELAATVYGEGGPYSEGSWPTLKADLFAVRIVTDHSGAGDLSIDILAASEGACRACCWWNVVNGWGILAGEGSEVRR